MWSYQLPFQCKASYMRLREIALLLLHEHLCKWISHLFIALMVDCVVVHEVTFRAWTGGQSWNHQTIAWTMVQPKTCFIVAFTQGVVWWTKFDVRIRQMRIHKSIDTYCKVMFELNFVSIAMRYPSVYTPHMGSITIAVNNDQKGD